MLGRAAMIVGIVVAGFAFVIGLVGVNLVIEEIIGVIANDLQEKVRILRKTHRMTIDRLNDQFMFERLDG